MSIVLVEMRANYSYSVWLDSAACCDARQDHTGCPRAHLRPNPGAQRVGDPQRMSVGIGVLAAQRPQEMRLLRPEGLQGRQAGRGNSWDVSACI